ncbi:GxxExxY protein [Novosphingobium naphthalenivorans]|uniref:GxxExxY protein n=1 Tax=Novosphingobium naphthalenivorans TaxID=273168 RepID=UPI0009FF341F
MPRHWDIHRLPRIAVNCVFHIHREIGRGLLESAYETVICKVLWQEGSMVERQRGAPLTHREAPK